jgi:hypothetical protein
MPVTSQLIPSLDFQWSGGRLGGYQVWETEQTSGQGQCVECKLFFSFFPKQSSRGLFLNSARARPSKVLGSPKEGWLD